AVHAGVRGSPARAARATRTRPAAAAPARASASARRAAWRWRAAGSTPVVGHPLRGQHAPVPLAAHAGDGVGRIGFAVEGDDARTRRDHRRLEPAHEAAAHAVAFEGHAPAFGPVADLALAAQEAGDVFLLVAHIGDGLWV